MATNEVPSPIAIIGSACRFPGGASNPSKLWELLRKPRDLLREVPRDRFHWEGVYRQDGLHGSIKTKHGYFLDENIRVFDPQFFGMSPAEAENIDPQHRLLMENVYETVESAGLRLEDLAGADVGVFVGLMGNEYFDNANQDVQGVSSGQILTTGTARSMAANRLSYTFDFRGPSATVDTACSSSMMAVHLAVNSLRRGESAVAFACGAHLNMRPNGFEALTMMNMISADGRSKMFDETADGYGRGEGTAVICLKPLDAAIRDGDPIECVIRETGTNQDGRTKGITMPNADAQTELIRRTYMSAGLDPTLAESRPSFFEAHGTGTLVGDPLEAQAVEAAFFPPGRDYADDEVLYIGSIKSIIGHTEGTAGLAGLLRAALAVRHGTIPPNLLFSRTSPKVQPYNSHVHLATAPNPWPTVTAGCPRRASANSFGFGGSNVHVILESYTQSLECPAVKKPFLSAVDEPQYTPFTFSAPSEAALTATLEAYISYLQNHAGNTRLQDLAWTLQYKRSLFLHRYAGAACTSDELLKRLETVVQGARAKRKHGLYVRAKQPSPIAPRIFGVFTGQGATWAIMGKSIVSRSAFARTIIARLDNALRSLPEADRPRWSLKEELMVDAEKSRINEATHAQPLTTAIQIMLVDLVAVAGLRFSAVVGHSSGEIAAAYAAGWISAEDAIRIAYYRGLHSKHADSGNGQGGGMLATFMTPAAAESYCALPEYSGQLVVAAYNSPSSVTLSGDSDAIDQALVNLQSKNIFARRLLVNKAYHSPHMKPCVEPYLESMQQLGMIIKTPGPDAPAWFSSTIESMRINSPNQLKPSYWIDNLISPVRFSTAISTAIEKKGVPDMFLEIGPHPSLEQPVRQNLDEAASADLLYTGMLKRGTDAIISTSDALGSIWCRFGRHAVNFTDFDKMLSGGTQPSPSLLTNLPAYPWQHEKEYWYENRFLRRRYQSRTPPTELLGEEWEIGASHEAKWRNFLNPREIPWLLQHQLNDVAVLPGAAYIVMASTAARHIFHNQTLHMIEVRNLRFEVPVVFPDEHTTIETILTVINISQSQTHAEADFFIDYCRQPRNDDLVTAVRGSLYVQFGFDADRAHPEPFRQPSELTTIDADQFYETLSAAGYNYTGPFRNIQTLQRKMDFATGEIKVTPSELLIHPAMLDGLFQASFASEGFPGDSAMPNFHVPSSIRSAKFYPTRCEEVLPVSAIETSHGGVQATPSEANREGSLSTDLTLVSSPGTLPFSLARTTFSQYAGILGSPSGTLCQIEGLTTSPFHVLTPEDDLEMFSETVWTPYLPHDILKNPDLQAKLDADMPLATACERLSLYFFRQMNESITIEKEQAAPGSLRLLLEHARLTLMELSLGIHPHLAREWLSDNKETAASLVKLFPESIAIKCIKLLGDKYPAIIAGEKTALAILLEDGNLNEIYLHGLGFQAVNGLLSDFVEKLTLHSPRLSILEIGAGTGSTTESIINRSSYSRYVFTDISSAFLGAAKDKFKLHSHRMDFKTYDMEKDPEEQGYELQSFEMIIASNVIHASADVQAVLRRLRSLLRPGGYLICVELAVGAYLHNTFVMGGLTGWWLGHGKDRYWTPALSEEQWHTYLQATGFSGLDAISPLFDTTVCPYRVFCSQAVDDRVMVLRKPLTVRLPRSEENLLILGAESVASSDFVQKLEDLLAPSFRNITRMNSLDDVSAAKTIPYAVCSLIELNDLVFRDMTSHTWSALRKLLVGATDVLWVTRAVNKPTTIDEPYASMIVGLKRSIWRELPHLRLTLLDVEDTSRGTATMIAQDMLRWYAMGRWALEDWYNDVLFPHYTELAIKNGLLHVPVVRMSKQRNDRYNSQHRKIVEEVLPHEQPVDLAYTRSLDRYVLRGFPSAPKPLTNGSTALVKMLYTTLFAFRVNNAGYLFLGFGVCEDGAKVITFSDVTTSFIQLSHTALQPTAVSESDGPHYLHAISAQLVAERVIGSARSDGATVVICNDLLLESMLRAKAARRGLKVLIVTGQPSLESRQATYLHHGSLEFILRQKIPINTRSVVNLSTHQDDEILYTRICSVLQTGPVKMRDASYFFKTTSSGLDEIRSTSQGMAAMGYVKKVDNLPEAQWQLAATVTISPKEAVHNSNHLASTIISWTADSTLPVTIQQATKDVTFGPAKTYLIVGSSDIARSICEWMIRSGARSIAIASRNPSQLEAWAKEMAAKDAKIHLGAMDVTDAESVQHYITSLGAVTKSGRSPMAPIGGVIHLGLALHDAAYSNMTFEQFRTAVDVKVKGSRNLHDKLQDFDLDFFILTSSVAYTVGNPGQCNYSCGNAFMVGLARFRRSVNLPASVVHLGAVTGIGYLQRNTTKKWSASSLHDLQKLGLYPISERDLHQIFAEAVLASPPSSPASYELITGLRKIQPSESETCRWSTEPRFTHLLAPTPSTQLAKSTPTLSVRQHLCSALATNASADVHAIVQTALCDRLGMLLQIDDIDVDASLLQMGLDSLHAAEIGSWARKELRVEMSAQLVFGGASVRDLADVAVRFLDRGWVMLNSGGKMGMVGCR